MPHFDRTILRRSAIPLLGLALSLALGAAAPRTHRPAPPLSPDDVSWLFPAPKTAADFSHLIAVKDLTIPDPKNPANRLPVWSDAAFQNFLAIADSPAAQVPGEGGAKIGLPAGARTKDAWFVAGVRIDAGAPGLAPDVIAKYGQRPQIRLILQPVLRGPDGKPQVVDTAAHLIFDFVKTEPPPPDCLLFAVPDPEAFRGVVSDVVRLRTQLASGRFGGVRVRTAGLPLGVHPGLANPATAARLSAAMKALLERRISDAQLHTMAMMGLPAGQGAPWIFVSMLRKSPTEFDPVFGPTLDGTQVAMMLAPAGQTPRIAPTPHPNNLSPITCQSATFGPVGPMAIPVADRRGHSTSEIFDTPSPDPAKVREVVDLIADPTRSHFFNTDCVSCHTETRRAMDLLKMTRSPGLSPSVMPQDQYNVRNFGWSPPRGGLSQSTATRRAAAETDAVVHWLNAHRSWW